MSQRSRHNPSSQASEAGPALAEPAAPGRQSRKRRAAAGAVTITLEAILWTALVGLVMGLRLASLDNLFLSADESARAFSAWLVSNGTVPEGWPGDATAALTSYLFRIFGSGDTVARLVPAVSGSALVISLWFGRRYFGRGAVLLAATLLALSPLAVHTSRSASAFALGGLLAVIMVISLLAYLEKPRPLPAMVLAGTAGLALGSDPIATSTVIALAGFLALEAAWRRDGAVSRAIATFHRTNDHWVPAAFALAFTLLLGIGQFGTDIDRLSLPGVRQWADMFALPGDGLPRFYQLHVLLGYEWPLLFGGAAAYGVAVYRWLTTPRTVSVVQRLLLMWTTVALLVVAFATRREPGQLLLLLLPLSLLAAALLEDVVARVDWSLLRRWWPAVGLVLALLAYALLQLSRWADDGTRTSGGERTLLVLALLAVAAILFAGFYYWGINGLALSLPVGTVLALPFLIHSTLSLGFGDGDEFAVHRRFTPRVERLTEVVSLEAQERGAAVTVEHPRADAIAWHLRDVPLALSDPPADAIIVAAADAETPPGFGQRGGTWRVAEGWIPPNFDLLPLWRWLAEREAYGNLSTIELQVLVPGQ